ncbi:ranBP-type and C3HC4-type zinc finger-containing protein 1 [Thalassophryne amazonica]|uniref:ranBP-type and C3HC4-type zinc finger-containing protein 1 n=1 Tax=Thalassophryne amazonica TaxID=390379 RepID=UPI001471847E|nr:ranBP-type and C3HC4-type zinc finger-containing protein 1 [Thalassophryne amazonica]
MASEVTLKEAEELARSLSEALSNGDAEEAASLSQRLSQLNIPVCVTINSQAYSQDSIRLKVGVEDAQSDTYIPVSVEVSADMTVAQLKDKFSTEYGFHTSLQRWVIGKRLAQDQDTLFSHGVRRSGDQAFLFILSAAAAHLTRQQDKLDQQQQCIEGIIEILKLIPRGVKDIVTEKPMPLPAAKPTPPELPVVTKPAVLPKPQLGWTCLLCTYINKPTRPGCAICGGERPKDYTVPNIYKPDPEEAQRIQQEQLAILQYEQAKQEERQRNFLHLLEIDRHSLVPNESEMECPVCFCSVDPGEGITLRECLHSFCKDCLKETVVSGQDAEVACPSCDCKLQDREIAALLTEEEHQRFLELRLSIAESRSEHSFHCQTLNCRGWCIYEDEVNVFYCELCNETNCILCRAIHKGMNCKDYQDDLRIRAENDLAAKQTNQMLERLLESGEAMRCPRCHIIVQKKDGCDWIRCLMCKTEICWVTKQARWGPNGTGDTSSGCRCRVNNQPCHPNCQNCH